LVRFAEKKVTSMTRNTAAPGSTIHSGLCQRIRAIAKNRRVVVTNVPVTAMP